MIFYNVGMLLRLWMKLAEFGYVTRHWAPWRMGDAVDAERNAGWTT